MDHSVDPTGRPDAKNSLTKWVGEMQGVVTMITALIEDNDRHRAAVEATQHQQGELREEVDRLRAEIDGHRAEEERLRDEIDRQRAEVMRQAAGLEAAQRERDAIRSDLAAVHAENDRLRSEQTEAGETAAKLLGEMKDLVNQVAHKFQGPSKTSPFAREPRPPQP